MSLNKEKASTLSDFVKGGDLDIRGTTLSIKGDAVQAIPLEIKVYNGNFDKAIKAFRALVQKERVLSLYKEKQTYEKPSQKRRRKKNESMRKQFEIQQQQKQELENGF